MAAKHGRPINNGLTARFVVALVIDPLTPTTLYVAGVELRRPQTASTKVQTAVNSWNLRQNGMTNTKSAQSGDRSGDTNNAIRRRHQWSDL